MGGGERSEDRIEVLGCCFFEGEGLDRTDAARDETGEDVEDSGGEGGVVGV